MAEEAKAETAGAEAAGSEKKGGATGSGGEPAAKKLGSTSVFGLGQPPSTSATLRGQVLATFPTALAGAATIVVSIGFVAAVGALMLWVRFRAAGLPADQAIVAVPREDVVSIGAVLLTQYVAIVLAAVLLVRFRDRYGNASPATRRALADLLL